MVLRGRIARATSMVRCGDRPVAGRVERITHLAAERFRGFLAPIAAGSGASVLGPENSDSTGSV